MDEDRMDGHALDISVTVFCQNEASRIGACVDSIAKAAEDLRVSLTVIVNGSSDCSAGLAAHAARQTRMPSRIYTIAYGDKANAINRAIHTLLQPARLHVFADGYAVISPRALAGLQQAISDHPRAVAATGVAANGRTMAKSTPVTLQQGGRLHGQLYALTPGFVSRMVAGGLRLPVGLYRGDSLLASMACHDLDAVGHCWEDQLAVGAAEATFTIPQLSPFRRSDIARQFRRMVRQMRGRLENEAIKSIIYKRGYEGLPANADDMIATWLAYGGKPAVKPADRIFLTLALREHARARRPVPEVLTPQLFA